MDFVAWCDLVLQKVVEASRKASAYRSIGVQESNVALALFGQEIVEQPGFHQSSLELHYGLRRFANRDNSSSLADSC